jgi:pilus assembly protein FimV
MHLNTRPKIVSFALKTLTSAVASAVFLSSSAYAAGLGKLTVMSSLGQPLRAEIELTAVSNEEAGVLVAKLAPADAFRLANIEFNPALLSLQFTVEQRNGRQYIKISSSQPVNEPFVDMLLELSWNNGRIVREYTFLLDPAELRTSQAPQVSAPVDVLSQGSRPVSGSNYRPAAKPVAQPKPEQPKPEQPPSDSKADEYKVKSGDTLGKIAAQLKPVDVSLDMMLVALYRANPDAFIGQNMNRLKSGQILSVPDSATIKGGGAAGEARGVVVAHAADFNAYRNKLAGQVATAAPQKAPDTAQSAGGKITAKVEERPTAANEAKDQLKLSKATPASATAAKPAGASVEDKIAKEKALADATARVKELERNVGDLEKIMTVKSKTGAEASTPPVAAIKPAEKPAAALPKAAPPPIKTAVKKPAPVAEPSFIDMLMDNIAVVGGAAAVLLLGVLGIGMARRRKQEPKSPTEPSILGAPTDQPPMFAETGGASVDTNNSVFNSSFAPSASQLDTNEVDPVAEADVYIAYGRDAQAEEILKEALRTHPERTPVRLKLLEIYAARKDARAFEMQAGELYGMSKGQGDDWAQAAALGLSIDPLNPLYANASSAAPAVASAQEQGQQAMLSQQLDDALGSDADDASLMDLDLGLATPAEAAPAPAAPAPVAKVDDDQSLDFDLGGLSFEPVSASEPIAMPGPAATPAVAEEADMTFTPAAAPAAAAPTPEEQSFDMAFDMAFDTPAPAAGENKPADLSLDLGNDISNDLSAEFDMADLDKSLDLPPLATPSAPAAAALDPMLDLDSMSFDLPGDAAAAPQAETITSDDGHDFTAVPDLPLPETPSPKFDMSSIDLDLPAGAGENAAPEFQEVAAPSEPGEMSAAHMEMETKLDLAIAYQEIGDKEGARELLDEVIKGGNNEQVSKANDMRAKLA